MEKFEKIKELIASLESDVAKHDSGNASAGTRVRSVMQEVRNLCKEVREEVLATQKERKAAAKK